MAEYIIKEKTPVLIGDPVKIPHELLEKLIDFFRSEPLIKKAFLKWMTLHNQSGYLIVIDMKKNQKDNVFPRIGEVINKYLKDNYADLVLYENNFKGVVKKNKPFYKSN